MAKQVKEMHVQTDCGLITVQEYDDEVANGIKIFLGDTIVAMVDCYRKPSTIVKRDLPTKVIITDLKLSPARDTDEQIADYLSNKYGYCINSFQYCINNTTILAYQIDWDTTNDDDGDPEARLLVYGPEGPDCDEPQQCIPIN